MPKHNKEMYKHRKVPLNQKMSERTKKRIKLMAALIRYPIPVMIIFQGLLWGWVFRSTRAVTVSMGVGFICFGIYEIIGYRLKFRHIFCANQNMHHRKMTPEHCEWESIPKSECYGLPAIEIIIGVAIIVIGFLAP